MGWIYVFPIHPCLCSLLLGKLQWQRSRKWEAIGAGLFVLTTCPKGWTSRSKEGVQSGGRFLSRPVKRWGILWGAAAKTQEMFDIKDFQIPFLMSKPVAFLTVWHFGVLSFLNLQKCCLEPVFPFPLVGTCWYTVRSSVCGGGVLTLKTMHYPRCFLLFFQKKQMILD